MSAVTIRDVAKHAAVGVGTVSRVINHSPNVSAATRQRVQEAISYLNYSPNPIARQLSLGKTMTIGAIVPTFTRPSFVERLRGVVRTFGESEYDLIIYSVESIAQRNKYLKQSTIRERVDGVIIVSIDLDNDEAQAFSQSTVPTFLLDAYHPLLDCVYVNDVKGGQKATQHLIDLGHTKIGFISDHFNGLGNSSMHDRFDGYCQALTEGAIPFNPSYHKQIELSESAARIAATELLQIEDRPTAIFAASDTHAIGVLQAAQKLGIAVPESLSVIGYDDVESAEYLGLTTIQQSLIDSGVVGAKMALEIVAAANNTLAKHEPKHIEVETTLIQRNTTSPPQ